MTSKPREWPSVAPVIVTLEASDAGWTCGACVVAR
jgi:hypothetical protein